MKTSLTAMQVQDADKQAAGIDIPNFSEPGTGKTLTTVGAIERSGLQHGLVVCPPVATIMWRNTLEYELGARVQWVKTEREDIDPLADFVVASSGIVSTKQDSLKSFLNRGALVLDECQQYKTYDAKRTQAIFGERTDGEGGIYEKSAQCWLLSGTPIERYYDDLWSMLRATQPEALQRYNALSRREFQKMFCRMEYKSSGNSAQRYVSVGNNNARLLNEMLYNDIGAVRRRMADVEPFLPLTRSRMITAPVHLSAEYKEVIKGYTYEQLINAMLGQDVQASTARRLLGLAKVRPVIDYIVQQKENFPLLVGYWHKEVGDAYKVRMLTLGWRCAWIDGSTATEKREEIRQKFMAGQVDVLFGQISAMGMAMDGLQYAGKHIIFAEFDWSGAKMEQFIARLARKGQVHGVQVDFCSSGESVDDALLDTANRKRTGAEAALNFGVK